MPIWAIDLDGLEPVFSTDGRRIVGYNVMPDQGPYLYCKGFER